MLGLYTRHVNGIRVMLRETGIIMNRSIHIPTLITIPTNSITQGVLRHFLFQRINHGMTMLQINIVTHT